MIPINILLDWANFAMRDLSIFRYIPRFLISLIEVNSPRADRSRTFCRVFSSRPRLRMSPVVLVRTVSAQRVRPRPSASTGSLFPIPPATTTELDWLRNWTAAVTWRHENSTGSLLSFNILASPLAAAARGIDMRSGFRLSFRLRSAPLHAARYDTIRHDTTTRHGTVRHGALSHASLRQAGQTFSSGGNLTNALHAASDIDMGMRRIDPRRARSAYLFGHRSRGYRTATAAAYGSQSVTFRPIRGRTSLYKRWDRYRVVKLRFSSRYDWCLYDRISVINRASRNTIEIRGTDLGTLISILKFGFSLIIFFLGFLILFIYLIQYGVSLILAKVK